MLLSCTKSSELDGQLDLILWGPYLKLSALPHKEFSKFQGPVKLS